MDWPSFSCLRMNTDGTEVRWDETVPPWDAEIVTTGPGTPSNRVAWVLAILATLIGLASGGPGPAVIFGIGGYGLGALVTRLRGVPASTMERNTFGFRLIVDDGGLLQAFTGEAVDDPYGSERSFALCMLHEIASIERRTYAETEPDHMSRLNSPMSSDRGRELAREYRVIARQTEQLVLVLTDGREGSLGWQTNPNVAALLQAELLTYLKWRKGVTATVQANKQQVAQLDADDTPL